MIGKKTYSELTLAFGVNDIDGTIHDTTKIYSMAGVEDQNVPYNEFRGDCFFNKFSWKSKFMRNVERDTVYNIIREY